MARFVGALRALAVGLLVAASTVGCQAVFGDFKIDDGAFNSASGGMAGVAGTAGTAGAGDTDGGSVTQSGPIQVNAAPGLYTTEWGGQATFSIVLLSMPKADVTIGLSSSKPTEGTVSPTSLVFTKDNYNAPQIVTVTGVDDSVPDPNTPYTIVTAPAQSADPVFNKVDPIDVDLYNVDNETAGITVAPTSGLVTSESGMQDTFTVVLNSKPTFDVTIPLHSSVPTEGSVSPSSLVFTSVNWMAPQLVTVTGVDDTVIDGPQPYLIVTDQAVSKDPAYGGPSGNGPDVMVTNLDNETAGVNVVLVNGIDPTDKTKIRTSESGDVASFTVVLNAPPKAAVTMTVTSDSVDEGTVSPASLTFTPVNWNAPQTVTVTGVDDSVADGDQPYKVTVGAPKSDDAAYAGVPATIVHATNTDNDHPGFSIMLVTGIDPHDSTKLVTSESGDTATFTIALNSKPTSGVTINLASSLLTEGTVSPGTLQFTTDNWNAPQTVTVKGVDDKIQDGNQPYYVNIGKAISDDKGYASLDPPDVQVTNTDNDTAGVLIALVTGIDQGNKKQLQTTEGGGTATFTIALASQPTQDVSITLVSSKPTEGTVSPATIKFTSVNYAALQTITVTGVDDKIQDGNQPYVIAVGATSSKDPNYALKFGTQVAVTNLDNDSAGIIVNPVSGLITSEAGQQATFTIVLQSQPTASVTIGVSSNRTTEGTVNVSSVTFTPVNWNAPQTIVVTGVQDDQTADGDQPYKIVVAPPTSMDPNYGPTKFDPPDISVTNLDDDSPGILINPVNGLTTTEAGGMATFTVALKSRPSPTQPVKLTFASTRPTEGTIAPAVLNFTNLNYNALQTIVITGVDDFVQDGPQAYKITGSSSSLDGKYNGLVTQEVNVTNIDNDSAGIRILPTPTVTPAITKENGTSSTFTVQLNSQPTQNVSFALMSSNTAEGTVSPATLSFTTMNWNSPITVTVTGVDDKIADGDQQYKVHISNATSMDPNYAMGNFATDVPFVNLDDDHPGLNINAAPNLQTKENGTAATFTVALLSQPTQDVTIALSSTNTAEGTVAPASLTFTSSTWNMPATVVVTGVDDNVADGPQGYSVLLANTVSTDPNYNNKYGTQVNLTNLDDDTPGFRLVGASGTLQTSEKGGSATFTVVLLTQPTGTNTVSLPVSSNRPSEGTVSPPTLLFTVDTWNIPQTVTVTGVDDQIADGPQGYSVVFGPATSGDSGYSGKSPLPIAAINADDDTFGINVTPTMCATTPGMTAMFSIVLNSQPGDSVSIDLSSDTTTEGTVSPSNVTFTTDNWNVAQFVTVTGVDDGSTGATTAYNIITNPAVSPGDTTGYNGFNPMDVMCTNTTAAPPTPSPTP